MYSSCFIHDSSPILFYCWHFVRMAPRRDANQARDIDSWLEEVRTASSVKAQQHKKPRKQHHITAQLPPQPSASSCSASVIEPVDHSGMARPGLRERKRPASPAQAPQPPPSKKRRATKSQRGRGTGQSLTHPTRSSVHFVETESQPAISYISSHSHPSTRRQRVDLRRAQPKVLFVPLDTGDEKSKALHEFLRRLLDRVEEAVPLSLR